MKTLAFVKSLMLVLTGSACIALGVNDIAKAGSFTEVEGNNTFGTAQLLNPHDGSILLNGSRVGDSSADFFKFFATAGNVITLAVNTPDGASFGDDPVLGLFNPIGTLLLTDDDSGSGYDSLISSFTVTTSGFYAAAVSGYPDFSFFGGGNSGFTYQLGVTGLTPNSTNIPTPALLPGLIGLGLGVWRKRKAQATKVVSDV